jgi:hypothetical protein
LRIRFQNGPILRPQVGTGKIEMNIFYVFVDQLGCIRHRNRGDGETRMPPPAVSGSLSDAEPDCASKGPTPTEITANVNRMPCFMFYSKAFLDVDEIQWFVVGGYPVKCCPSRNLRSFV